MVPKVKSSGFDLFVASKTANPQRPYPGSIPSIFISSSVADFYLWTQEIAPCRCKGFLDFRYHRTYFFLRAINAKKPKTNNIATFIIAENTFLMSFPPFLPLYHTLGIHLFDSME